MIKSREIKGSKWGEGLLIFVFAKKTPDSRRPATTDIFRFQTLLKLSVWKKILINVSYNKIDTYHLLPLYSTLHPNCYFFPI